MKSTPYGAWKSPITSDLLVAQTLGIGSLTVADERLYWLESRPAEGGRNVIVSAPVGNRGSQEDVTPAPYNVRTRVHEYGGGAYLVGPGAIYFSNFADQRIYTQDLAPGAAPKPLTADLNVRYADAILDPDRNRLICVREDHGDATQEPVNTIAAIDLTSGLHTTLVAGHDFYSSPRLSPDGKRLCWIGWHHPNMPWDNTQLHVSLLAPDGRIERSRAVTEAAGEAVLQPRWGRSGELLFVSDRSGWWNLYRHYDDTVSPITTMDAEFGAPAWAFGVSSYAWWSDEGLIAIYSARGRDRLATIELKTGDHEDLSTDYTKLGSLQVVGDQLFYIAASPSEPPTIVRHDLSTARREVIKRSTELHLDNDYLSTPEAIEFPTENGLTAHAFYYPPKNRDYASPEDEKPPLLVKVHGGPTGAADDALDLEIQYWTTRGFAVADVNYGGSSGYGREYRRRLNGQWGVVDVDDTVNAARFLVARGDVDGDRLAIRGGSAGGFTTLSVLTFRDVFKAGASYYGVSDLEALVMDTHKFESRYLDTLVAPYPDGFKRYHERSPIHHVGLLSCPIIFFQGLEDRVVPPSQAVAMVEALHRKKLPVAYLPFEGEQHGFRSAANIKKALDAEFYFFSRVFGYEPADDLEPVPISAFEGSADP